MYEHVSAAEERTVGRLLGALAPIDLGPCCMVKLSLEKGREDMRAGYCTYDQHAVVRQSGRCTRSW